jgi:hypothetical protein
MDDKASGGKTLTLQVTFDVSDAVISDIALYRSSLCHRPFPPHKPPRATDGLTTLLSVVSDGPDDLINVGLVLHIQMFVVSGTRGYLGTLGNPEVGGDQWCGHFCRFRRYQVRSPEVLPVSCKKLL